MNAQRLVLDEWNTKPNKIIFWLNNRSNRIRVQVLRTQGLGKSRIKLAKINPSNLSVTLPGNGCRAPRVMMKWVLRDPTMLDYLTAQRQA